MTIRKTTALLLAGLTLGFAAQAAETAKPTADEGHAYFNGVKVAIDPATGRLRQPTAAEMKALRAAVVPSSAKAASIGKPMPRNQFEAEKTYRRLKDGSVMMQLPESSMTTLSAATQADGSVRVVEGDEKAAVAAAAGEIK